MTKKFISTLLIGSALAITSAQAAVIPIEGGADARVKYVVYHERDIVEVIGHYGYSTTIEFGLKEKIQTISMGDSEAWQVVNSKSHPNLLFIKPLEPNATTNMTVVTSDHIYSFDLRADKAKDRKSKDLTFRLRFSYPDSEAMELHKVGKGKLGALGLASPEAADPDDLNFDYSFDGSDRLRPLRSFDNGKFTFLQFAKIETTPAVFMVDEDGKEAVVNFHKSGKYIVVERLGREFRLRDGDTVATIYNEDYPKLTHDDPLAPKEREGFHLSNLFGGDTTQANSDPSRLRR